MANIIADSTVSTGQATLSGLAGDDTYEIASATAIILKNSNEGTDTVRTALATYSLAAIANVENLTGTMPGPYGQNLSGNGLNNIITASSVNAFGSGAVLSGLDGNDTLFGFNYDDALYGGVGDDSMVGGFGSDSYIVDSIYDEVVELDGEGIDFIRTELAVYFLPSGVEYLNFNEGSTAHIGYGNALENLSRAVTVTTRSTAARATIRSTAVPTLRAATRPTSRTPPVRASRSISRSQAHRSSAAVSGRIRCRASRT